MAEWNDRTKMPGLWWPGNSTGDSGREEQIMDHTHYPRSGLCDPHPEGALPIPRAAPKSSKLTQ